MSAISGLHGEPLSPKPAAAQKEAEKQQEIDSSQKKHTEHQVPMSSSRFCKSVAESCDMVAAVLVVLCCAVLAQASREQAAAEAPRARLTSSQSQQDSAGQ